MTSNHDALTTEEVANLLKVSKLTVYDLIKKGLLPSYRVGRQIRVEREALEAYKQQGNTNKDSSRIPQKHHQSDTSPIIITGQDQCLDILARELESKAPEFQSLRSHMGSMNGLINMYHGKADIVSTHLYDGKTKTYNLPYIQRILVSEPFIVIHLLTRQAGLYVKKGNPKNIHSWESFGQPNIRMINREKGSGARVLLDEQLRLHQVTSTKVNGYYNELSNHIGVANAVANNEADIGVGAKYASRMMAIDFIPMIEESYDLVILATERNKELIKHLLSITKDNHFKSTLRNLGFNTEQAGKVLYEQ